LINNFSSWVFNLMLWGAVFTFVALLYATYVSPVFLHEPMNSLIALGVIAVLSLLWPKY